MTTTGTNILASPCAASRRACARPRPRRTAAKVRDHPRSALSRAATTVTGRARHIASNCIHGISLLPLLPLSVSTITTTTPRHSLDKPPISLAIDRQSRSVRHTYTMSTRHVPGPPSGYGFCSFYAASILEGETAAVPGRPSHPSTERHGQGGPF